MHVQTVLRVLCVIMVDNNLSLSELPTIREWVEGELSDKENDEENIIWLCPIIRTAGSRARSVHANAPQYIGIR